ncbi:MAG: hypothetical protein AAF702_10795 [Chloroflexota bacterium]
MNEKSTITQIDDQTFLSQFEDQTLDPVHFKHLGHLRLAWIYLERNSIDTAAGLVCSGIQAYAESLGATPKFHRTITDAMVRIMARRLNQMVKKEWQRFLDENNDLVEDALSVLYQHYSKDVLFSEVARTSFVQPDIEPI